MDFGAAVLGKVAYVAFDFGDFVPGVAALVGGEGFGAGEPDGWGCWG